jgi:ATP-binding cassette subfamily B protein
MGYLRSYWHLVAGAYLLLLLINGLSLVIPQLIRGIVDRGIRQGETDFLIWSVLILLGLTLVKGLFAFLQGRWTESSSQGVAYDIRNAINTHLSVLSFSFHDRTSTGELLSRSIQDVERIRFLTGRAVLRLIDGIVLFIGTAVVLLTMNLPLALMALASIPLLGYQAWQFGRRYRPLTTEIQEQLAVLTTRAEQNLQGARVVKAFAQEEEEIKRFERENSLWFRLVARSVRLLGWNIPLLSLIANVGMIFIIGYGGLLVIRQQISLGMLVAFSTYLSQLIHPVRRLGMIIPAIAQAATAGKRILEIIDAEPDVRDRPNASSLPRIRGEVIFEEVSFSYHQRQEILSDITFEAKPGQVIALLGSTGSGKSTIINLIPRFYEPTRGAVMIDGYNTKELTLDSLRSQIGIVLQDTTLFASKIRDNLAFGAPDASYEEITEAAKAARAHRFIIRFPEGYDTVVGEKGDTLSGGQKQRIAIARAILSDPRILIMDDATSNVDTETEQEIQVALEKLMEGRTAFVIAQRLSTVRRADLILVLERGRIVAQGSHADLIGGSGIYADIYHHQLRGSE